MRNSVKAVAALRLCLVLTACIFLNGGSAATTTEDGPHFNTAAISGVIDNDPDEKGFSSSEQAELKSSKSHSGSAKDPVPGNPYNCWGTTDQVHPSNSFASLHSRNYNCTRAPEQSLVGAEIMKKGLLGEWHRVGYNSKEERASYVDVNAKSICSDSSSQTYRGNGYHRVVINETWYTARTSSNIETRFGCNAHG